jgi:hypothetical protein
MTAQELLATLNAARETFVKFGVTGVAPDVIFAQIELLIRAFLNAREEEVLTLPEAARRSGYSAEHLGRLIREGKLPNAGVKNRPLVRAGDLPIRPGRAFAAAGAAAYDPATDARTLLGRRGGKRA